MKLKDWKITKHKHSTKFTTKGDWKYAINITILYPSHDLNYTDKYSVFGSEGLEGSRNIRELDKEFTTRTKAMAFVKKYIKEVGD